MFDRFFNRPRTGSFGALVAIVLALIGTAYAKDVRVNCDEEGRNSINRALEKLDKPGPHTIFVAGTCNEAVDINEFDRLRLIAEEGASINDPTPDDPSDNVVVTITNSRLVTLEGFTINGGINGVACFAFSSCILNFNTIQGASGFAVAIGRQSSAELFANLIWNSFEGLSATFGAEVVVFGGFVVNLNGRGIAVTRGSFLRFGNVEEPTSIQGSGGPGIAVAHNSTLTLLPNAVHISYVAGDGILLEHGAVAEILSGNTISANGGNGVSVGHSSHAQIDTFDIVGNAKAPVACVGTFSNAKGAFSCNTP